MTTLSTNSGNQPTQTVSSRARTRWTACAAHALHDGYTDLIYLLLPSGRPSLARLWRAGFLRGLAAASMAGLQVPMGHLAERIGGRATLALGTALAAIGYVIAGYSGGLVGLFVALVVVGCGLSTQHRSHRRRLARLSGRYARPSWHLQFLGRHRQGRHSERSFAAADVHVLASHALGAGRARRDRCGNGRVLSAGEPAAGRR